jgi:integrase
VVVRFGSPGKPTKNGRIRRVPLFGLGLEACRTWLEALPTYVSSAKISTARANAQGLFAPTRHGACRHKRRFSTTIDGRPASWTDVVRIAGLGRRVRWHDLRHTCASFLVAGWWGRRWSLEEVKELLGHSSIKMTERYAHLAESALQRAARETSGASPREVHEEDPADDH